MREIIILAVFASGLLSCILMDVSILYALAFGYILFFSYGLTRNHTFRQMLRMSGKGIRVVRNILLTFLLIGMITAVWRACGTIPFIIYHSARLIAPSVFLLAAFLLCCLISTLTGTALGTAATVGVICMTIANAMNIDRVLAGGAILSGIYFGDRCSPMSTSALLVAELTHTNIYRNIRNMVRTSLLPFTVSCLLYWILGRGAGNARASDAIRYLFSENFRLHWIVVVPAALVVVLAVFRINVKAVMALSILAGSAVHLFVQKADISSLLTVMASGFHAADGRLAVLMDGGGILSMLKVGAIVCISSCYAGIFDGTGILEGIKDRVLWLSERITPYGGILVTSIVTSMAACNQTLSIMLTHQICGKLRSDDERTAVDLENTVVVIAPLVPWSVACATPLAAIGAPVGCVAAAFYLYSLALWNLIDQPRGEKGGVRPFGLPGRRGPRRGRRRHSNRLG